MQTGEESSLILQSEYLEVLEYQNEESMFEKMRKLDSERVSSEKWCYRLKKSIRSKQSRYVLVVSQTAISPEEIQKIIKRQFQSQRIRIAYKASDYYKYTCEQSTKDINQFKNKIILSLCSQQNTEAVLSKMAQALKGIPHTKIYILHNQRQQILTWIIGINKLNPEQFDKKIDKQKIFEKRKTFIPTDSILIRTDILKGMNAYLGQEACVEEKSQKYSIVEFDDQQIAIQFYCQMHSIPEFELDLQFVKRQEEMSCVMVLFRELETQKVSKFLDKACYDEKIGVKLLREMQHKAIRFKILLIETEAESLQIYKNQFFQNENWTILKGSKLMKIECENIEMLNKQIEMFEENHNESLISNIRSSELGETLYETKREESTFYLYYLAIKIGGARPMLILED